MTRATTTAPLHVRVEMAHAAAQWLAHQHGIRLLHVKGPALDKRLSWSGRTGTDADVLVSPHDTEALLDVLQRNGWDLQSDFENNSSFEHAATLWHTQWGYIDVHRRMPGFGLDPDEAFELLWGRRSSTAIASIDCPVPDYPAQALVMILHAGRSRSSDRAAADLRKAWHEAATAEREAVQRLVAELNAEVGFAAAVGGLDAYRGAKDYDLWRVASQGGTRVQEWRARMRAAPSRRARVKLLGRAFLVNTDHLAMTRGRQPSRGEILAEFFARFVRVLREETIGRRRWSRRRR